MLCKCYVIKAVRDIVVAIYRNLSFVKVDWAVVSSAAHRRLFDPRRVLPALLAVYDHLDDHPVADELPDAGADEDRDDDEAVEVHGQQHDKVGEPKGRCVQDGADDLLQRARPEGDGSRLRDRQVTGVAIFVQRLGPRLRSDVPLELALDEAVVLLAEPAEELQTHHHQNHADAARGHHAGGPDPPGLSQETWARFQSASEWGSYGFGTFRTGIYCVPIP